MHTIQAEHGAFPGPNRNTVEVRLATSADANDVYQLIEEYYEAVEVVVRDDRGTILQYLSGAGSGVWLALVDGAPAGCVLLRPLPGKPDIGEVKRMYVRPAFRGRAIASRLMSSLAEHARAAGMQWLYLDTKDDLLPAIRFYEQRGFERCERYNDNPQATIFMRKRLGSD